MSNEPHRPNKLLLGLVIGGGLIALVALTATLDCFSNKSATVLCAVQPGDPDADLGTDQRTLLLPSGREDNFLFQEQVVRANKSRVVKSVLQNRDVYLTMTNVPYVKYEFYRPDGTLERTKLVFPETGLGASVYCRWREDIYDIDGQTELFERYYREDGTIGVESDKKTHRFTEYRADGKTLRRTSHWNDQEHETVRYRLDGKTVWWRSIHRGITKVYFDEDGKPCNRQFLSEPLTNGFSHGPGDAPIPYATHLWFAQDGKTPAFKQTWYALFEGKTSFHGLGKVEVYGADGKTVVTVVEVKLQLRKHGVFVTKVEHRNADGSKLVRTYRSPGNRESEETFDATGKSVKKEHFLQNDRFIENFDLMMFDGSTQNWYGEYDTDAHDI